MVDQRMVRVAELEVDPAQLAEYRALLTEEIAASIEREPDVLMLHAMSDKDRPHRIRILEVYASAAAYQAHIQAPHFLEYKAGTLAMVTSLKLVEVDSILLASK